MTKNKLIKLISIVLALTLLWQSVVWASDGFSVFRQKDTATCLRTLAFEERDTESAPGAGRVPNKRSVIFKTILLYGALAVVACVGVFVLMTAYSMGADIYSLLSAKEMWKLFASNTGMAFMALGLAGYSYAHILWVRLRDYLNQLSEFTKTPGEIPEHWPVDIYDPQPEKEATEAFWWREDRRYQRIRSDADLGMFKFPEGYDADKIRYYIRQEKKTHGRKVDFVMLYHFKENPG